MSRVLKLGTRKSLLAWAQSGWVARRIESLHPGVRVELVGIETRGDRVLDVPLRAVEGKEFFVAELDDALRSGRVDLTVHSMKDLSLDRPEEFTLGAIPKRENPRDVVLFGPRALERLREGKTLRIGTSSPRRLENIPPFLAEALPGAESARLEFVEIRGNVNTRLGRVREPESSERYLDAVVLAFAGLIRLWADEAGRAELRKLLEGVRWMILPLRECPTAPAQGALAVECRADDVATRALLGALHDERTAANVARERALLADWGGGCHQKFGGTCFEVAGLGQLFYVRGVKPDETFIEELRWPAPPSPAAAPRAWDGVLARGSGVTETLACPGALEGAGAVFVAHSRAFEALEAGDRSRLRPPFHVRVWTSGVASWKRLARQGVWVEGCAESLGFEAMVPTASEGVLQLPAPASWRVLTHEGATEGWERGQARAVYRARGSFDDAARAALRAADHVFWGSGSQFDELKGDVAAGARHACGPGKTAQHLKSQGVEPTVFPSVEEWRKWITGKSH